MLVPGREVGFEGVRLPEGKIAESNDAFSFDNRDVPVDGEIRESLRFAAPAEAIAPRASRCGYGRRFRAPTGGHARKGSPPPTEISTCSDGFLPFECDQSGQIGCIHRIRRHNLPILDIRKGVVDAVSFRASILPG